MPSTTTAPGRWPAAISSLTMLLIACAAPLDDGLAMGGAAAAGVVADVQEITTWQTRPSSSRRSAEAALVQNLTLRRPAGPSRRAGTRTTFAAHPSSRAPRPRL